MTERTPVTIVSGTLGAGKTTLLNHVLDGGHGYEVAVLVNDVGEINVDAEIVDRHTGSDEVVELSNGCICCGLQGELERSVVQLHTNHAFDHLVVEPSGISEPAPVARPFVEGRPSGLYRLKSVTTVVDARQFYDAFENGDPKRRGPDGEGTRPLSDLVVEGVEFCDRLVVNKTDLVTEAERQETVAHLRTLQPEASIITTEYGELDPKRLFDGADFDRDRVEGSARWRQVLDAHDGDHDDGAPSDSDHGHDGGDHDHTHPPEEYGIDSFVYHRPEPMHPERLTDFLGETPDCLVRAKGWLHIAGRPDCALELSLAGPEAQVTVAGRWIASLPENRQQRYRERRDPNWTEAYGDRETRLVVIGRGMDVDAIEQQLDDCLLTDDELFGDPEFENQFPEVEGQRLRLSPTR